MLPIITNLVLIIINVSVGACQSSINTKYLLVNFVRPGKILTIRTFEKVATLKRKEKKLHIFFKIIVQLIAKAVSVVLK